MEISLWHGSCRDAQTQVGSEGRWGGGGGGEELLKLNYPWNGCVLDWQHAVLLRSVRALMEVYIMPKLTP